MTSFDQDLGERDDEEQIGFPPNEQWDDGTLELPELQREYVWDNARASRLIESLLLNIPIPNLYFAETEEAKYQIVDGHQRVYSVIRYLDNQYRLSGLRIQDEFKGLR